MLKKILWASVWGMLGMMGLFILSGVFVICTAACSDPELWPFAALAIFAVTFITVLAILSMTE